MGKKSRKPGGRPFVKGDPRAGRPKGTPNKVTQEVRAFAQMLLDRPRYQESFLRAWDARKLPSQIEVMVWHYAHGKPKELHEVTGLDGNPIEFVTRIERVIVNGTDAED